MIMPKYLPVFQQASVLDGPDAAPTCQPYNKLDQTLLELLASQGDLCALEELAERMYNEKKNDTVAVALFQKGAEAGNQDAMFMLANCYFRGIGVDESNELYFQWLQKAAEGGSWMAARNMATAFFYGRERYDGAGFDQSDAKALEWSVHAADLIEYCWRQYTQPGFSAFKDIADDLVDQYAAVCETIAKHYQSGKGTEKNYAEAIAWLKKGNEIVLAASGSTYPYFDSGIRALSAQL